MKLYRFIFLSFSVRTCIKLIFVVLAFPEYVQPSKRVVSIPLFRWFPRYNRQTFLFNYKGGRNACVKNCCEWSDHFLKSSEATIQPTFVKVTAREPQTRSKSSKEAISSTFTGMRRKILPWSLKKCTCDINHFIDIFCPKRFNPLALSRSGFHICSKRPTSDNDPAAAFLTHTNAQKIICGFLDRRLCWREWNGEKWKCFFCVWAIRKC